MSTALVPVAAMARAPAAARASRLASVPFLAHLIATARHAPQTRERRRAEPGEAVAVYSALDLLPKPTGRTFSRSL